PKQAVSHDEFRPAVCVRAVDHRSQTSAARSRGCQPSVVAALWQSAGSHSVRLWQEGNAADASRIVGLAGCRICRTWLEYEAHSSLNCHIKHVSVVVLKLGSQ